MEEGITAVIPGEAAGDIREVMGEAGDVAVAEGEEGADRRLRCVYQSLGIPS